MPSKIENSYAVLTPVEHRKKYGQFFTNPIIAEKMIRWLLKFNPDSIFDPAFGMGAFYFAHKKLKPSIPFHGNEIDHTVYSHWQELKEKAHVDLTDYFQHWHSSSRSAIVCNPPYMRFQNFSNRSAIIEKIENKLNIRLSGLTNIASAFLMKSIYELKPDGVLAYLMPLEFLNTGYGKKIKQTLLKEGIIHSIQQIQCEKDVFPEVTTSVGLIYFQKKSDPNHSVEFSQIDSIEKMLDLKLTKNSNKITQDLLDPAKKWQPYFSPIKMKLEDASLCPLSTYGHFKRGIATGANSFFTLSEIKAKTLNLPKESLTPCITKSSQIKKTVFRKSDFEQLCNSQQPVFLVDLEKKIENPSVRKYIEFGVKSGIHARYLTRMKDPWYKIEKRDAPPLYFGVFSREKIKVIRNYSSAVSLTCYHGFKASPEGLGYVDALFLFFQSQIGQKILSQNMRKYGENLKKFEPNDLNSCLVPRPEWFKAQLPLNLKKELAFLEKNNHLSEELEDTFMRLES